MGKTTAVIGAQYGSEGKGVIVHHIANEYDLHVRVGSPNAGHTFYWNGEKHVQQSIPCGWTNPRAKVLIGRGALINMRQLMSELEVVEKYYPGFADARLIIDSRAGILDECFKEEEGGTSGDMHRRIGSTGEGVGPARVARINRNPANFRFFEDVCDEYGLRSSMMYDTPLYIRRKQDIGSNVLLEGTQGSALSLLHGPWPYVTSIDTNAAQLLAECGIPPSRLTDVILVARTHPIRVAGNSGPMNNETSWEALSEKLGFDVLEKTTVTKKVRRVSEWDTELFRSAVVLNAPTEIALTFADYLDPSLRGSVLKRHVTGSARVMELIDHINSISGGAIVTMVGTGGPDCSVVDMVGGHY